MAAGDPTNTTVWKGTDAYVAPVGTTAPTDLTTAWPAAYKALGLVSEDGLTIGRDQDTDPKYDSYGSVVRVVKGNETRTFTLTVLEDNAVLFDLLNPGSTAATTTGVTTRTIKTAVSDPRAFGFQNQDGATIKSRLLIPKGEVTEVGETQRQGTELASREITITVYPAADGTLYKEITNAPGAVVT